MAVNCVRHGTPPGPAGMKGGHIPNRRITRQCLGGDGAAAEAGDEGLAGALVFLLLSSAGDGAGGCRGPGRCWGARGVCACSVLQNGDGKC